MRIGMGYDVHPFIFGRPLVLGGEAIPFSLGLQGHSDADVIVHAVIDAILGAMALEDIGAHFPDSDGRYKDVSSIKLLKEVAGLMTARGWSLVNLDVVALLQDPRLSPYRDKMRHNIADALGATIDTVSIKATSTEGLGFTGRGEGIAAQAVVLLEVAGR